MGKVSSTPRVPSRPSVPAQADQVAEAIVKAQSEKKWIKKFEDLNLDQTDIKAAREEFWEQKRKLVGQPGEVMELTPGGFPVADLHEYKLR